jgi:predicted extracellular nuclease
MFRIVAAACLLAGCASVDSPLGGARDLSGVAASDLSGSGGDDLAGSRDLARSGDGGGGSPDLAMSTPPDMTGVVYDLATSCSAAQHLLINEVKSGGALSVSDEFIEIYNPCALTLDLTGWKLIYRSAAGTTDVLVVTMNKPIAGSGYYLIASSVYTGAATPDQTYMGGHLAAAGGGLAIKDPNGMIVDSMGYGTASDAFVQGAPAPAPPAGQSTARIPNGANTNNNSVDFKIATTPTPRAAN